MPVSAAEAQKEILSRQISPTEKEELKANIERITGITLGLHLENILRKRVELCTWIRKASPADRTELIELIAGPFVKGLTSVVERHRDSAPAPEGKPFPPDSFEREIFSYLAGGRSYNADLAWHATWCGYFGDNAWWGEYGTLLVKEIELGEEEVYAILRDSLLGEHAVGIPSELGLRVLLSIGRPDGIEAASRLALNAGRQEGLRSMVLNTLFSTTPKVLHHGLRLVIEHNLLRFTSAQEFIQQKFPELGDLLDGVSLPQALLRLAEFLVEPDLEPASSGLEVYLRLKADLLISLTLLVDRATRIFDDPDPKIRLAVALVVHQVESPLVRPVIEKFYRDSDLPVRHCGVLHPIQLRENARSAFHDLAFQTALEWPSKSSYARITPAQVWEFAVECATRETAPLYRSHLDRLSPYGRSKIAGLLLKATPSPVVMEMMLTLLGDTSNSVRRQALNLAKRLTITTDQLPRLESLLQRKAADLRIGILELIRQLPTDVVRASSERLQGTKDKNQQDAGRELAARLPAATALAPDPLGDTRESTAFGLSRPEDRTWGTVETPDRIVQLFTPGAILLINRLDAYIHSRSGEEVPSGDPDEPMKPLGLLRRWEFEKLLTTRPDGTPSLLLQEVQAFLDADPELAELHPDDFILAEVISSGPTYAFGRSEQRMLARMLPHFKHPPEYLSLIAELTTALGASMDQRPGVAVDLFWSVRQQLTSEPHRGGSNKHSWRAKDEITELARILRLLVIRNGKRFSDGECLRVWNVFRYMDQPDGRPDIVVVEPVNELAALETEILRSGNADAFWDSLEEMAERGRMGAPAEVVFEFFSRGVLGEADFFDQLLQDRMIMQLSDQPLTGRFGDAILRMVRRIAEIEATRGELPSPASAWVGAVRCGVGIEIVSKILATGHEIGRASYGSYDVGASRQEAFGHLLCVSRPLPGESLDHCVAALSVFKKQPERLLTLALLSPYWAEAVQRVLEWDGLEDAIWWLHAHTQVAAWGDMETRRNDWQGLLSERTPLTGDQFAQGYCDAPWFARFATKLSPAQWKMLHKQAKFASTSSGHVRAQQFARALQGELKVSALFEEMHKKRNPTTVRAIGLCPLGKDPDREIRERYQQLQEFLAASRQFGAMKRDTEKLAVEVALDNLARTAGFPDSLRMVWALEAREVEDLAGEGLLVTEGDLSVRLFFDFLGQPQIETMRAGKLLKELPASAKKIPAISALVQRRTQLKKQLVRMRASLEQAMQRGDDFSSEELEKLLAHPGLLPLLQSLVFVTETGALGFPDEVSAAKTLRIAHPVDLLASGQWPQWQQRVFREERIQPFKQVFRELYVLTPAERDQNQLTRFAGHQVQGRQAVGILGKRGWVLRPEEGMSKAFHRLGLIARIDLDYVGYSPAEIEGVPLRSLVFTKAGSWESIPLAQVPPIVFSETVRDLDLIVSVAHMSGFDPEVSESTVEMRTSLVRETASLLGLENLEFEPRHVRIRGQLAEYRVHLGSGLVHQTARGELVIVAVRQPQRGRLFLPFVDDDPRSAEVLSKVILLARDHEIQDPTILSQIVGV